MGDYRKIARKLVTDMMEREQHAAAVASGSIQREYSPFRIHVLSMSLKASHIKTAHSFIVYLDRTLDIDEIRIRMRKGFGDLK